MNLYLTIREIQVWGSLIPSVLFVIGYAVTEFSRRDLASWYIMGWGLTCTAAFSLSAIRFWFPDATWTRHAGIVLGFMVLVMVWWMLATLIWVWRKYHKKEAHSDADSDSK